MQIMKDILFVESNGRCEVIVLVNLLYVSSTSSETYFFTTTGVIVSKVLLPFFDQYLSKRKFCRIHAAHMISLDKIISFDSQAVLMPGALLPLSKEYESDFRSRVRILSTDPDEEQGSLFIDQKGKLSYRN
jgi:hypothetical protein